jgi:hypothetical protein
VPARKCLVIDCLPASDSRLEGKIVKTILQDNGRMVRLVPKPTKEQALRALFDAYGFDIVHISAHGSTGWLDVGRGTVGTDEIESYFESRLGKGDAWLHGTKLLVNSICNGQSKEWQNLVLDRLKFRNYIACRGDTTLAEGLLFPTALYLELAGSGRNLAVTNAYRRVKEKLKDAAHWELYGVM